MGRSIHRMSAVTLVDLPEGFMPTRPWTHPPGVTNGVLYARKLSQTAATGFAQTFNTAQLAERCASRKWAIAVASCHRPGRSAGRAARQHAEAALRRQTEESQT
jgi:hypothetical protein